MEKIFIGRQPILNKKEEIFGYELLFRRSETLSADVTDNTLATATIMINALNEIGLINLLGKKKGFINVNYEILSSGFIELLPKNSVVLEILETAKIDNNLITLCNKLKHSGFLFALDDFVYNGSMFKELNASIFDLVDYVKFDIINQDNKGLSEAVGKLKGFNVRLLAEKVEDKDVYKSCLEMGFDLFQGYFFAKPVIIEGKATSPSRIVLIELFNELSKESNLEIIDMIFKKSPELDIKLLKFINSASFYLAQKITSIRQAVITLGYRNLQKWVSLMLFAKAGLNMKSNPLLERAAVRGFFMESLCYKITKNKQISDSAFITGMLSLIDALLGLPLVDIINGMNLSDEIEDALLNKKGFLSELLQVAYELEENNFIFTPTFLNRYNLTQEDLFGIETDAILSFERMDFND